MAHVYSLIGDRNCTVLCVTSAFIMICTDLTYGCGVLSSKSASRRSSPRARCKLRAMHLEVHGPQARGVTTRKSLTSYCRKNRDYSLTLRRERFSLLRLGPITHIRWRNGGWESRERERDLASLRSLDKEGESVGLAARGKRDFLYYLVQVKDPNALDTFWVKKAYHSF